MIPLGVTSGIYDYPFDLSLASSYNPAFITANSGTISGGSNALIFALEQGGHTLTFTPPPSPAGSFAVFLFPSRRPLHSSQ